MKTKFYLLIFTASCAATQSLSAMRQRTASTVKKSSIKVEKETTQEEYAGILKEAHKKYIARDYPEAIVLFRKVLGSPCGYTRAQVQQCLGRIYFYGVAGIAPNNRNALHYLRLVAKQTHNRSAQAEAWWCLGAYFFDKKQLKKAAIFLKLASEQTANTTVQQNAQKSLSVLTSS